MSGWVTDSACIGEWVCGAGRLAAHVSEWVAGWVVVWGWGFMGSNASCKSGDGASI